MQNSFIFVVFVFTLITKKWKCYGN